MENTIYRSKTWKLLGIMPVLIIILKGISKVPVFFPIIRSFRVTIKISSNGISILIILRIYLNYNTRVTT